MSSSWLLYMLVVLLGGNPLLALALVVASAWGGNAWWRGRAWRPWAPLERWRKRRELRANLAVNPHDLTTRGELGRMLVERGQYAQARDELEQVCGRGKTLALPAWNLGQAYLKLGDLGAGQRWIEHALSLRKDLGYGQPVMDLGDYFFDRQRYADALPCYERGLAVHGGSIEGRYKLGRCRLATGDASGARAIFDEAIQAYDASPAFKRAQDRAWRWRAWWWRPKS